jgi:hypothetical protein
LIDDVKTYKHIVRDPTLTYEREFNGEIRNLERKEIITKQKMKELIRNDSICSKAYGLIKVHKLSNPIPPDPDIKLRPIVSCQKSPSYNMSKFLCDILNRAIDQDRYNIKNSYVFRDFIKTQLLPPGYKLISLDVVSLFTCIPWERVEDAIERNWPNIGKITKLRQDDFTRLLKLIMDRSYFSFGNKFYRQIDGTAMGSPGSPAIADLVMTSLLDTVVPKLREQELVIFVKKYVDDLILAVRMDATEKVLEEFNNYNQAIQFTMEQEVDMKIPFLDMLLIRKDDGTVTTDF